MQQVASSRSAENRPPEEDRKRAKEIEKVASQVGTSCLKFPMHQSGLLTTGGAKDRYVAAVPADEVVPDADWATYVKRWRRGKLGYWQDKEAYQRREVPKGYLDLV